MSQGEAPLLLTVKQTGKLMGKTEAGVRHLIFYDVGGFSSKCVVRIGRSVRVREDRLAEFIEHYTGAPPFVYSDVDAESGGAA